MSFERQWAFRVEHILDAIAQIQEYTSGMTEESFSANRMVVDAVLRNFQIIGEAVRQVPGDVQAKHPEIPWSEMQGMRHVLVHDYDMVRLDIVWRTIRESLPPIIEPLKQVLAEVEDAGGSADV